MSSSLRPRPASLLWSLPGPEASTAWPWGARSTGVKGRGVSSAWSPLWPPQLGACPLWEPGCGQWGRSCQQLVLARMRGDEWGKLRQTETGRFSSTPATPGPVSALRLQGVFFHRLDLQSETLHKVTLFSKKFQKVIDSLCFP